MFSEVTIETCDFYWNIAANVEQTNNVIYFTATETQTLHRKALLNSKW